MTHPTPFGRATVPFGLTPEFGGEAALGVRQRGQFDGQVPTGEWDGPAAGGRSPDHAAAWFGYAKVARAAATRWKSSSFAPAATSGNSSRFFDQTSSPHAFRADASRRLRCAPAATAPAGPGAASGSRALAAFALHGNVGVARVVEWVQKAVPREEGSGGRPRGMGVKGALAWAGMSVAIRSGEGRQALVSRIQAGGRRAAEAGRPGAAGDARRRGAGARRAGASLPAPVPRGAVDEAKAVGAAAAEAPKPGEPQLRLRATCRRDAFARAKWSGLDRSLRRCPRRRPAATRRRRPAPSWRGAATASAGGRRRPSCR